MAATYGNRSDYVNKAIDNFRLAIKEDPSASFLVEDMAERTASPDGFARQ